MEDHFRVVNVCLKCGFEIDRVSGCNCQNATQIIKKVEVPKSKADTQNPKDLLGTKKPSLTKIPAAAIAWESLAMMDGADKYGAYNWRDKKVVASIYIDACKRHLDLWFDSGEEEAEDSKVHHLGHARACLGILLDAQTTGNLIDDRPVNESSKGKLGELYKKLGKKIVEKQASKAALETKCAICGNSCTESHSGYCPECHWKWYGRYDDAIKD